MSTIQDQESIALPLPVTEAELDGIAELRRQVALQSRRNEVAFVAAALAAANEAAREFETALEFVAIEVSSRRPAAGGKLHAHAARVMAMIRGNLAELDAHAQRHAGGQTSLAAVVHPARALAARLSRRAAELASHLSEVPGTRQ